MSVGKKHDVNEPRDSNTLNLVFAVPLSILGGVSVMANILPRFWNTAASFDAYSFWFGAGSLSVGVILGAPRGSLAIRQVIEVIPFFQNKAAPKHATKAKEDSIDDAEVAGNTTLPELEEAKGLAPEVQLNLGLNAEPPPLEEADTDMIRQTLFESNIPTYILNQDYHLLDWNPAFEIAFDTQKFKRLRHVSQIVYCLANKRDVLTHGAEVFGGSQKPLVDFEILEYVSPTWGRMEFTKITSQATHTLTGETIGWNVVLNVNSVEKRAEFEKALDAELVHHVNWRIYSAAYDKVLTRFKGYRELVKRHCNAVGARKRILDLGAGTGNVSLELLKSGKKVVAVDYNEAMLSRLREKCRVYSASGMLQVVKQNLESMHVSTADRGSYDGAILLNVLYALNDPLKCLRMVNQALGPNGIVVVSGPKKDSRLDTLFAAMRNELQHEPDWDTLQPDFENVLARNQELEAEGVLYRFTMADFQDMLEKAGFQVVEQDDQAYAGQAMFLVAKKV